MAVATIGFEVGERLAPWRAGALAKNNGSEDEDVMLPKKVLLISRDAKWRRAVVARFGREAVLVDETGEKWTALLGEHPEVDFILIDHHLGKGRPNGSQILRELRLGERTGGAPRQRWRVTAGALRQSRRGGRCIGLFSTGDQQGFSAVDRELADFFVDKRASPSPARVLDGAVDAWHAFVVDRCRPSISTECDPLRAAIVHRPSTELSYVDPMDPDFLMEEQPGVSKAARQHEGFVRAIQRESGALVLDSEDLLRDVFELAGSPEARQEYVADILYDPLERHLSEVFRQRKQRFPHFLADVVASAGELDSATIVRRLFEGWNTANWKGYAELGSTHSRFVYEAPNAYFTRDPGFALDGVYFVSNMTKFIRRREARMLNLVLQRHPWFAEHRKMAATNEERLGGHPIEGGDVIAVGPRAVAIGESERTAFKAINRLAQVLFATGRYDEVFAVPIPDRRAFMHLDTVFSVVGPQLAVIHPQALEDKGRFLRMTKERPDGEWMEKSFVAYLKAVRGFDVVLTGGGDPGRAISEQVTDATNCFALAPNHVVVYEANEGTNRALRDKGVVVTEIDGSELVKGRGGPRCMTMPISRG